MRAKNIHVDKLDKKFTPTTSHGITSRAYVDLLMYIYLRQTNISTHQAKSRLAEGKGTVSFAINKEEKLLQCMQSTFECSKCSVNLC